MFSLSKQRLASRSRIWRQTARCSQSTPSRWQQSEGRQFHMSARRATDGVYPALTEMRVRTPWVVALKESRERSRSGDGQQSPEAVPSIDVTPKTMSQSYHKVVIPLGQDQWLLDYYMNASGHIRLGALLMDLDALSGVVAYKHTGEGVSTVTAAVDRITIKHPLKEICDLELSGFVSFATGRSSMEVSLQVAKAPPEGQKAKPEDVFMTCAFTMVSLNSQTKRPVNIAPLKIETEEEQRIFDQGAENHKSKKAMSKMGLLQQTPNDEESDLIHQMWLKDTAYTDPRNALQKPDKVVYMDKTRIHSAQIMQPQYRNRHNFMIFGGFLLKHSFELAFTCAAAFAKARPIFLSLDPSNFENPVPVGSVLYLTATVVYTDPPLVTLDGSDPTSGTPDSKYTRVQVRVDTKVRNVEHENANPTGRFHYTFLVEKSMSVMPRTYSEYMSWVDARRRARLVADSLDSADAWDGHTDGVHEPVTE